MCGFKGEIAKIIYNGLRVEPEFEKSIKHIGNDKNGFKDYIVYTCIKQCGYNFGDISLIFNVGTYIKVEKND